jgi:hypothetical protein
VSFIRKNGRVTSINLQTGILKIAALLPLVSASKRRKVMLAPSFEVVRLQRENAFPLYVARQR